jgi:hypothetical protein
VLRCWVGSVARRCSCADIQVCRCMSGPPDSRSMQVVRQAQKGMHISEMLVLEATYIDGRQFMGTP